MPDKDSKDDLAGAKKRVSDRLLPLDFISGVGIQGSGLTVYLTRAIAPDEEQKVKKILDSEASGKPVEFIKTGKFKAN
ncbi:MAG TPA: hypothetical protein VGO49_21500 [Bradyrhizobium sp.]|nr:hypothetical protein [Bradyrhizobium sp.]